MVHIPGYRHLIVYACGCAYVDHDGPRCEVEKPGVVYMWASRQSDPECFPCRNKP